MHGQCFFYQQHVWLYKIECSWPEADRRLEISSEIVETLKAWAYPCLGSESFGKLLFSIGFNLFGEFFYQASKLRFESGLNHAPKLLE